MTNFEISVDRSSSWCHLLAGMSLHFLCPIGTASSTKHAGFARTSPCCAWVSSMRDWFISLAVIPYWLDWVLARDEVTLPRSGFVLDKWLPEKFSWMTSWRVPEFQFHTCQDTLSCELEHRSKNCSLCNRSKDSRIRVCTRTCTHSAYRRSIADTIIII